MSFILSIPSSTVVQQITIQFFIVVKKYFLILEFSSSLTNIEIHIITIFPSFSLQLREIFGGSKKFGEVVDIYCFVLLYEFISLNIIL